MIAKPLRREPLFKIPAVVIAVIAVCVLVHLGRSLLGREADFDLVARFAFVPVRLTAWFSPAALAERMTAWVQSGNPEEIAKVAAARFFVDQPVPPFLTLVTYAVFHGDWTHLGFNTLWLVAFGTPVARRFGQARFLAFMLAAAVAGAFAHWLVFPYGVDPVIGASASVSGCMGAALRFMFASEPSGTESTAPHEHRALSLSAILRNRRALSFLVIWFGSNALFGIGSVGFGLSESPVAWQAHIGGFLLGLLLFPLFDPKRQPADAAVEPPPTE